MFQLTINYMAIGILLVGYALSKRNVKVAMRKAAAEAGNSETLLLLSTAIYIYFWPLLLIIVCIKKLVKTKQL